MTEGSRGPRGGAPVTSNAGAESRGTRIYFSSITIRKKVNEPDCVTGVVRLRYKSANGGCTARADRRSKKTMKKQTVSAVILSVAAALALAGNARADDISVTPTFDASNQAAAPDTTDYEGIFYDDYTTFPPSSITIGTFDFTVPTGESVISATISGTFGDVNEGITALADLYVGGGTIQVAGCDLNQDSSYPPCAAGTADGSLVPWSYTFSAADLSSLAADFSSGSLDFTAVQNGFGSVIVGSPVLDLQAATPEPASFLTLAGGLLALAAFRRRK